MLHIERQCCDCLRTPDTPHVTRDEKGECFDGDGFDIISGTALHAEETTIDESETKWIQGLLDEAGLQLKPADVRTLGKIIKEVYTDTSQCVYFCELAKQHSFLGIQLSEGIDDYFDIYNTLLEHRDNMVEITIYDDEFNDTYKISKKIMKIVTAEKLRTLLPKECVTDDHGCRYPDSTVLNQAVEIDKMTYKGVLVPLTRELKLPFDCRSKYFGGEEIPSRPIGSTITVSLSFGQTKKKKKRKP